MDGADVASLRCHLTRPGINYKAIAECGWITTTMKISCIGSQNGKCDEQNKREKNAVEQKVKEMKLNLFFFSLWMQENWKRKKVASVAYGWKEPLHLS